MRYLLDTLAKRDLFAWLTLAPSRWWHCLVYRDEFNWGGVEAALPPGLWEATAAASAASAAGTDAAAAAAAAEEEQELLSAADAVDPTQVGAPGGPKLAGLWNLKEFLPPALQEHLALLLAEFAYRPWKEAALAAVAGATQGGSQAVADARQAEDVQVGFVGVVVWWCRCVVSRLLGCLPCCARGGASSACPNPTLASSTHNPTNDTINRESKSNSKKPQVEYLKRELNGSWADRLMTKVQAFAAKCPPGSSHPECQFPLRAGSHLTPDDLGSPALAFVRTACHVLSLDAAVADEVALLRRRLLKLLGVGEFSAAAQFREPCMSFRLPDVICGYCNDCRDLDLCRDPELQAGGRWACRACGQGYDMAALEARLVGLLGARVREYALQDLQCLKCKQVRCGLVGAVACCCMRARADACMLSLFLPLNSTNSSPLIALPPSIQTHIQTINLNDTTQIATEHLCGSCKGCGGALTNTVRPDDARKRLVVFRNLAAYHGFELLQQLADDALALA